MDALEVVGLAPLMKLNAGDPNIPIGLIDGPVALDHPGLADAHIRSLSKETSHASMESESLACQHGTFLAGILVGRRDSAAPAICPDCTLLIRPIFPVKDSFNLQLPSTSPQELATAIVEMR